MYRIDIEAPPPRIQPETKRKALGEMPKALIILAGGLGFEPRLTESENVALLQKSNGKQRNQCLVLS
jgi:hypothetical protein